jgi:Icc-related predicted phosphoesterase
VRLHVVSDVHQRLDALTQAGDGADALVCLGDLLLFVDYADPSQGIFPDLFGVEQTRAFVDLRTAQRFDEARQLSRDLWTGLGRQPQDVVRDAVRSQYEQVFAALPVPAYVTFGNVDLPDLADGLPRPGHVLLDGATTEIGGLRFGFVGGGLRTRYRTPNELSDEAFAAKVAAVGAVDVLCCHVPPALPEVTYDVVARRFERGSTAVLDLVRRTSPWLLLHGHVHQPLVARTRVGRTESVNVGHFRATGLPFVLDLQDAPLR